jgi:nucleoporin NUP2
LSSSQHDEEGEGEESEETLHATKVKVFRLKPKEEGAAQGWADLGVGS